MFKCPRNNLIESDEGFVVEIMGRTGIVYKDEDGEFFVDGEALAGAHGFMIYRGSIRRNGPDGADLTESKCDEIIGNVVRAFGFLGYEIETY